MVRGLQGDEKYTKHPGVGAAARHLTEATRWQAVGDLQGLRHARSTRARSGGVLGHGECLKATRFALGETVSGVAGVAWAAQQLVRVPVQRLAATLAFSRAT